MENPTDEWGKKIRALCQRDGTLEFLVMGGACLVGFRDKIRLQKKVVISLVGQYNTEQIKEFRSERRIDR
jgi:hypothetical protein